MHLVFLLLGIVLCTLVALDAFQTVILPRRPAGRFRITRLFYMVTWTPWVAVADRVRHNKVREQFYSIFGPVSLLVLLVLWASMLISGFALVFWGLRSPFTDPLIRSGHLPEWLANLRMDAYVSGTTLFTLGLGDVVPHTHLARALLVTESGVGLGFVALVIGYLPVIYQAFSRREVNVAMLDARGGSPPTATELLRRHGFEGGQKELVTLLADWERWSAEILESHISYPVLCMYRSQHDNQSWLSALVAIMDLCALIITTLPERTAAPAVRQAQLTFAMSRHALIDLGHVFHVESRVDPLDATAETRLPAEVFNRLCDAMGEMQMTLCGDPETMRRLTGIRELYEPHAQALSAFLRMPLPMWIAEEKRTDPWRRVHALRRGGAVLHVSEQSTALDLHDEEHGFAEHR